jgi:hypothetical protein
MADQMAYFISETLRIYSPYFMKLVIGEPQRAEAHSQCVAAFSHVLRDHALVAGSIFDSGLPMAVTQTAPSPTAISPPAPGTPTSMVADTLLVAGSTRVTLPSP